MHIENNIDEQNQRQLLAHLKEASNKCSSALVTMHASHCTTMFYVSTTGIICDSLDTLTTCSE